MRYRYLFTRLALIWVAHIGELPWRIAVRLTRPRKRF